MTVTPSPDPHGHTGPEIEVPHLEADETVPPRPEEEVADATRNGAAEFAQTSADEGGAGE